MALSTGTDSPVMADWSTAAAPAVTMPSTGMRSPLRTSTVSPMATASTATTTGCPSRSTVAWPGMRLASSRSALLARAMVKFSRISPNIIMKATRAAALYSPMRRAAIMATLTITPAVRSPLRMPRAASRKMGEPPTRAEATHRRLAAGVDWKTRLATAPAMRRRPLAMVTSVLVARKKSRYRWKNEGGGAGARQVSQATAGVTSRDMRLYFLHTVDRASQVPERRVG